MSVFCCQPFTRNLLQRSCSHPDTELTSTCQQEKGHQSPCQLKQNLRSLFHKQNRYNKKGTSCFSSPSVATTTRSPSAPASTTESNNFQSSEARSLNDFLFLNSPSDIAWLCLKFSKTHFLARKIRYI